MPWITHCFLKFPARNHWSVCEILLPGLSLGNLNPTNSVGAQKSVFKPSLQSILTARSLCPNQWLRAEVGDINKASSYTSFSFHFLLSLLPAPMGTFLSLFLWAITLKHTVKSSVLRFLTLSSSCVQAPQIHQLETVFTACWTRQSQWDSWDSREEGNR